MGYIVQSKPPVCRCSNLPRTSFGDARGTIGDIYRCDDCGKLWRVGWACEECDAYDGRGHRISSQHLMGQKWRPATLWQRIKYRKQGH